MKFDIKKSFLGSQDSPLGGYPLREIFGSWCANYTDLKLYVIPVLRQNRPQNHEGGYRRSEKNPLGNFTHCFLQILSKVF